MDKVPDYKIRLMANIVVYMDEVRSNLIRHLKQDRFLAEADWDMVEELTTIKNPYASQQYLVESILQRLKAAAALSIAEKAKTAKSKSTVVEVKKDDSGSPGKTDDSDIIRNDRLQSKLSQASFAVPQEQLRSPSSNAGGTISRQTREEGRQRILQLEKVSYWRQFGAGLLSHRAISNLTDRVDECVEQEGAALDVDELCSGAWTLNSKLRNALDVGNRIVSTDNNNSGLRLRNVTGGRVAPEELHNNYTNGAASFEGHSNHTTTPNKHPIAVQKKDSRRHSHASYSNHKIAFDPVADLGTKGWLRRRVLSIVTSLFVEILAWIISSICLGIVIAQLLHYMRSENITSDASLLLVKAIFYTVLLLHLVAKVCAWGAMYFRYVENIVEICFSLVYLLCIIGYFVNVRYRSPPLYFVVEVIAGLRVATKLIFLVIRVLPMVIGLISDRVSERAGLVYDSIKGFIVGEEEAAKSIEKLIDDPMVASELQGDCRRRRRAALKQLAMLASEYRGAAVAVATKQAARCTLNGVRDAVEELTNSGILDAHEARHLAEVVHATIADVSSRVPPWLPPPTLSQQLANLPWISVIDRSHSRKANINMSNESLLNVLIDAGIEKSYSNGEVIYREGAQSDGVYVLTTGIVKLVRTKFLAGKHSSDRKGANTETTEDLLYPGRQFGDIDTILAIDRYQKTQKNWKANPKGYVDICTYSATAIAEIPTEVFFISGDDVFNLMNDWPHIAIQWAISYCIRRAIPLLASHPSFIGWNELRMNAHLTHAEFIDLGATPEGYQRRLEGEIIILVRGTAMAYDIDSYNGNLETFISHPWEPTGQLIPPTAKSLFAPDYRYTIQKLKISSVEEPGWLFSVPPVNNKFHSVASSHDDFPTMTSPLTVGEHASNSNDESLSDNRAIVVPRRASLFDRTNMSLQTIIDGRISRTSVDQRRASISGSSCAESTYDASSDFSAPRTTIDLLASLNRSLKVTGARAEQQLLADSDRVKNSHDSAEMGSKLSNALGRKSSYDNVNPKSLYSQFIRATTKKHSDNSLPTGGNKRRGSTQSHGVAQSIVTSKYPAPGLHSTMMSLMMASQGMTRLQAIPPANKQEPSAVEEASTDNSRRPKPVDNIKTNDLLNTKVPAASGIQRNDTALSDVFEETDSDVV